MADSKKAKPPTIAVGVEGFNSEAPMGVGIGVSWEELLHLPKFQMYACEVSRQPSATVMDWIGEFVMQQLTSVGEQESFDTYLAWHDAKGYWPDEDCMGNLKNGDK